MPTIYDTIETVARDLYWKALKDIPEDVRNGVRSGLAAEKKDGNLTAENVLFTILENIKAADEQDTLVCQDTGLPVYKVLVGNRAQSRHSGIEEPPAHRLRARHQGVSAALEFRASAHAQEHADEHRSGPADHQAGFRGRTPMQIEIHMAPKGRARRT